MQFSLPLPVIEIIRELRTAGYRAILVGGVVRDTLLGTEPTKDIDIEVYGVTFEQLTAILQRHGRVDLVGQSFGVAKLTAGSATYDFSVPRRDSKLGAKHRDFQATFDPQITPKEAASRRDFTINAMAWDPVEETLLDFFGGEEDLRNRVLRATSDAFSEDPLRVLRGMQFACRFDLTLDPATATMCQSIAGQYDTLAGERVAAEFMKWALQAPRPGRIAGYLKSSGWERHFPEIAQLAGVPQDPGWHPEGDVDTHTMLVVDAAAAIAAREGLSGDARAVLLFSALSHDFAKPATTQLRERDGLMRWSSWGHEAAGGPLARGFLKRIHIKSYIVDQVVPLVENHLAASTIGRDLTTRAVRRLAVRLAPASIDQLMLLIEADHSGRPPLPGGLPENALRIQEAAHQNAVRQGPPAPLVLGRHVLPYFEDKPGRHIGEVTEAAYQAQLDGEFSDEAAALVWLKHFLKIT
ncbi:MAG: HD domain-containing protein [Acidobacteriota bacterium]